MIARKGLFPVASTLIAVLGSMAALRAQQGTAPAPTPAAQQGTAQQGSAPAGGPALSMDEIEGIVAPIALYPDVLISQILPAATFPTDIVQAHRWVQQHPDLTGVDSQPWDPSVLSVARYPSILDKMNNDLDWTNALGAAFLDQPDDVFNAIQTLRQQAQTSGVLESTPQQTVVEDEGAVRIVPAEEQVIYVPQYDPQIIYSNYEDDDDDGDVFAASAIGFGTGMAMGAWLDNDCDWNDHVVCGCRPGYWGGWGWHGHVNWDNDWYAHRGPRRGFIRGEDGGVAWGPNGRAVWGDHGSGVWRRPAGYRGRPAYTGRYRNYGNFSGNRRTTVAGNTFNRNNVNVNVDRGDRTNIRAGDRTRVGSTNVGDRTRIGGDRTDIRGGDRTRSVSDRTRMSGNRTNLSGNRTNVRSSVNRNTAINDRSRASQVRSASNRGAQSRQFAGASPRSSISRPQARPTRTTTRSPQFSQARSRPSSSAFSQRGSSHSTRQFSNRGSMSRGHGGGGHRGGGGRRGGRR
jgi:hypothetical protein